MQCATVETGCRLCGRRFEEDICWEEKGAAWKTQSGHLVEDGSPWCSACLEGINATCARLLESVDLDGETLDAVTLDAADADAAA